MTTALQRRRKASAADGQDSGVLERLLRDRLRKFMSLLLKVLAEDADDAVHDLRVWSRRLQQVVVALASGPLPPQARTMVRALRRARRSLGEWRDCDVLIDLLERKARRVRNLEEKRACEMIRDLALNKRERQIRRARRKLASRKLFTLGHRAQKFLDELPHGERLDAARVLASSIADGHTQWREALSRAYNGSDPANIHAFRIRTKQLRYRIELVRDLGESDAQAALGFLKSLQDELGCWHDQAALFRLTAEALADPEFLLSHPRLVAALLRKSDRAQAIQGERIRRLLTRTYEGIGGSTLDDWVARHCREMPPQLPAEPHSDELVALKGADCAPVLYVVPVQTLTAEPIEDFIKARSELPS
jgi:CHAD domain-containing protein